MHGNNRRGGGRRFGKPYFDKTQQRRYKSDVKPEQLCEQDVGITEYISVLDGFSGVLKARFSDFQVNEINVDGEIAKFTDTTPPKGFDADSLSKNIVIPKETPCEDIPQDVWTEILAVVVDGVEDKVVELESTDFDKEKRGNVHRIVKNILQQKVVASTITRDEKKYITFKKYNKEDKVDNRTAWPADKEEYVHFLVYKENIDTMEATLKISDCVRINPSSFNYAGVKDRRSKTTQWFSVRKVNPLKLLERTKCLRNIHIGNITFKDKPLKLGKLQGNRFRIALRNVMASDELINNAMESLREKGFVNYYGLQRFGNVKEVPTYEIGIKLLLGNFKEACNLILKCKKCDNPHTQVSQAKKKYLETGDANAAAELLSPREGNSVESKLLQGLSKSNVNDYVTALENIPRNMRLLYINAFQALVWNKVVSRRIQEFGLNPIVGDLVLVKEEEVVAPSTNENETDVVDEPHDSDEEVDTEEVHTSKKKQVKILTAEDLEHYSIYDVVLPMPGYDITYPESVVKDWYKDLLEGYGLTLEMPKQSVKRYSLSGTYRHIIKKVTNLSWKVMHYNDPNDDLLQSDFDEFLKRAPPVDKPDGKFKALIIDFCLTPSCYATMVVREILKTDTSANAQTKLNDYHTKKEPPKIVVTETTEQNSEDLPAHNSLLADSAKYEDFKKAIFGFTSEDDSLKRKIHETDDDSEVPKKILKEDAAEVEPSLV